MAPQAKGLVVKVAQTRKPGRKSWKVEVTLHDLDKGKRTHLVRVDVDDDFLDECGPNGVAERMGQNMEEAVIRALRAVLPGKKVEGGVVPGRLGGRMEE